ncbi:MAG: SMC family ATPase, partial [Candidatus Marsarchaeota archaeon]|nr:SMC family ATPase [Candidatus Marsarchaeota archaeon]
MITEIVLRNWKAHERTSLSFQKGVNVLIGIMGAGKSSVMDAISFGLFGTFPALKQRRIKTEQLLKSRPKKEDSAEIKLSFVSGNDVYTVTRQISASGGATARLEKNGEYLQTQPIRVNEEISSILKIDYDTFARAVYSEQNGLDYFLNITKSERKRQIDDMLGLDQFASAEENCTSLVNSIKSIIDNEKQALDRVDIAALKKELSGKSAEKEAVLESQKKLDGEAGRLREELLALDSKIRNMKKAIEKREGLEREAAEINSKMKLLIAEIEKIKKSGGGAEEGRVKAEKEKLERVLKGKNDEHADLMKKERNASGEVLKLQAEIADTERKIKERNSILNKIKGVDAHGLEREIDEAKSRLEGLMGEKEAISVKIKDAKESAAKLKKHLAVCPVCERELDDDLRALLLKKRENELTRMEADLNEGAGEITILEKALKGLQEKAAELSLSSMRLKDFEGLDEKFEKSNKELEKTGKEADGLARTGP